MDAVSEMACSELVEVITEYLEGALDAVDRRRFEEHLATCPGCRNYLEQMRTTIRLTGMLRSESLSPSARRGLLDAFRGWRRESAPPPAAE
jgi:anti-sigma factor RsiW